MLVEALDVLNIRHTTRYSPDGRVRIDLRFRIDRRSHEVVYFSINVGLMDGDEVVEVYRVDTAHGHLHEQRFWLSPLPIPLSEGRFSGLTQAFAYYRRLVNESYSRWVVLFELKQASTQ